jgi:hypothetical protein
MSQTIWFSISTQNQSPNGLDAMIIGTVVCDLGKRDAICSTVGSSEKMVELAANK